MNFIKKNMRIKLNKLKGYRKEKIEEKNVLKVFPVFFIIIIGGNSL